MNLKKILREYNEAKLIGNFGAKIYAHYVAEFPDKKNTTPENIIKAIAASDPTQSKELTFWVCNNYANKLPDGQYGIKKFEDISRAFVALAKFKASVRKFLVISSRNFQIRKILLRKI